MVSVSIFLVTALTIIAFATSSFPDKKEEKKTSNQCRLYMAPTTVGGIKGNYGIFTSIPLNPGSTVLANDGPNIPVIVDYRKESTLFPGTHHLGLFDNVWWGHDAISDRMHFEVDQSNDGDYLSALDLQINFGALPNCNPYRSNLVTRQPADGIDYNDDSYLSGPKDPTRGSFSYYTGKHFFVDGHVAAGTELFLDYGSDWEQHGFPRRQDYFSAAALIRKWMLSLKDEDDAHGVSGKEFVDSVAVLRKLIEVASPNVEEDSSGYEEEEWNEYEYSEEAMTEGVYQLEELTARVLSVMPSTTEDLDKIHHISNQIYRSRKGRFSNESIKMHDKNLPSVLDVADAMHTLSQPVPKTAQELEETGICLDHIVAGQSATPLEGITQSENETIGRGAMASRALSAGEIIVPVPLLHLLDRTLFEKLQSSSIAIPNDELILNYCFGHFESTMLLCPVTNAVLINHCSNRSGKFPCGGNITAEPNAYYRWASDSEWDRKTKDTLEMTLGEMAKLDYHEQHRMLSMEIVALRDIQEGEEIFIDYGRKWEDAWLTHVNNWSNQNKKDDMWSSSITEFQLNHRNILTIDDDLLFYGDLRGDDPAVSENGRFMATCWYQRLIRVEDSLGQDDDYWKQLTDQEIISEYAIDAGTSFVHYIDNPPGTHGHFWPCSIISKELDDQYLVRIYPSELLKNDESSFEAIATHLLLKNYPRSSIKFVTVPYKSDQHHPNAFRHHIEIRDEIFPDQWKNKKLLQEEVTIAREM